MLSRAFCVPGVVFLLCALVLNFLVSISLPFLPALDIARTHFGSGTVQVASTSGVTQIRFGIWTSCNYNSNDDRTCLATGHAYSLTTTSPTESSTVGSSWTRGLVVHPIATAVTFIAFCLSLSTHLTVALVASLTSFLAGLLTLIAFAIDIALFARVRHQMKELDLDGTNTNTAPGFWLTLVAFVLLLLAGCTVCFGRRRNRMAGATTSYNVAHTEKPGKRPFFQRFGRNKAPVVA